MAFKYKVVGTDLKMNGKLYKEGAVLISANKLDYDCLESVTEEVPREGRAQGKKKGGK